MDNIYDFHTHTFLSDGSLSPIELIRRAVVKGYKAVAITDHAGVGTLERIIRELVAECALAQRFWDIIALPGVELTHLPPAAIDEAAKQARQLGARIVVVHGETPVEPVEPGTNRAALLSPHVSVLAHPGLITQEEAELAAQRGVFLELSARKGHSLTNGRVIQEALHSGAKLVLNSDAHDPDDLLTYPLAKKIALGAGLGEDYLEKILSLWPKELLQRANIKLEGL